MKLETLHDLHIHELQDLHSVETQIKAALPDVIKAASDKQLKAALKEHLEVTKGHLGRLNTILKGHGEKQEVEKCKGMEGILAEGADIIEHEASETIRDLAICSSCQSVEHYEIAGYGAARAYADTLGYDEDAALLSETLDEESAADTALTTIATLLQSQCETDSEDNSDSDDAPRTKTPGTSKGKTRAPQPMAAKSR